MATAVRYTDLAFDLFARRHNDSGEGGKDNRAEMYLVLRNMSEKKREHLSCLLRLPPPPPGDKIAV